MEVLQCLQVQVGRKWCCLLFGWLAGRADQVRPSSHAEDTLGDRARTDSPSDSSIHCSPLLWPANHKRKFRTLALYCRRLFRWSPPPLNWELRGPSPGRAGLPIAWKHWALADQPQTMGRRGNSLLPLAAAGLAALVVALVCTGRRARGDDEDRDEKSSSASSAEGSGHVDTTGGDTKERSEGDATEHTNNPAAGKSPSSIAETVSSGSGAVLAESAAGNPPVGDRPHEVFFLYEGGRVSELRSKITRVLVAPQVTEIPDRAFRGCDKLVEVQLIEGLQIIGRGAFRGCTALRSVMIPSTVTELDYGAFGECSSLVELELNEGLQVVGQTAFFECAALRSVAMPSTVTKLGDCAFSGCSKLIEVC